jgi:hypothetical protein
MFFLRSARCAKARSDGAVLRRHQVRAADRTAHGVPGVDVAGASSVLAWEPAKVSDGEVRDLVVNGKTYLSGQANNFYIFPAVGMAITMGRL